MSPETATRINTLAVTLAEGNWNTRSPQELANVIATALLDIVEIYINEEKNNDR